MQLLTGLIMVLLLLAAVLLIVLVLIQRGKGGGLAGAFGGMGGQSAFGTKAGDLFTKITIGVAIFWIVLCIVMIKLLGATSQGPLKQMGGSSPKPGATAPASPSQKQPSGTTTPATPAPAKTPAK